MAQIPRKYIDSYTEALNKLSDDAQAKLASALSQVDMSDVAAAREAILEIMETLLGPYTDMAAVLAAEFYDGVRTLETGAALGALAESGREPIATEKAVRGIMQTIVTGGSAETVIGKLKGRVDYELKRAATECVYRNGERDPKKPLFVRVPSGVETCHFCMMLASRGPERRNKANIKHGHENCNCRIVQTYEGQTIEGYDEKECRDKWNAMVDAEAEARAARNGTTVEAERAHIMNTYAEASKRAKQRARENG